MIPKIIHFCWFGGNELTKEALKNIEKCKLLNPDYEVKIWSEDNFDINQNSYCKEAYQSRKWAFVTDFVRLKVLYEFGGIYMDTDVETLKNFDDLLFQKAFSGFESNSTIPTGLMAAEKGNQWIKMNLDYYDNRHFVQPDGTMDLTTNVITITNITKNSYNIDLNNQYQDLGDVAFYPFDFFCCKDLKTGKIKVTNNSYTIHHFAGSWLSKKDDKIKRWLKNHHLYFLVIIIVKIKHLVGGKK